jgi:hypothetical protein
MKTTLITLVIVFLSLSLTNEQDKVYKSWFNLIGGTITIKGNLYEVKDSSIVVSEAGVFKKFVSEAGVFQKETRISIVDFYTIPYEHIITIKLRRQGKLGTGFLIGFFSGFFIAHLIGVISGDDADGWFRLTAGQKALLWCIPLVPIGSIIGTIIGSKRIVILINGDFKNFSSNRDKLKHYSIVDQNTYQKSKSKK